MHAKLMAYESVPPGFEMVIIGSNGIQEVKAWSHWFNIKLSDDPETWDDEIAVINRMQRKLGRLSDEQRLIRAQMAEFCRRHPLFPHSIDILCKEIGAGRFTDPVKIGCEGRDLLDSLGYHTPQSLKEQRERILKNYMQALKKWPDQDCRESSIESKVFRFLGQPTETKRHFVDTLITALNTKEPSISLLKERCGSACRKTSILDSDLIPFPFGCFTCQSGCAEEASTPVCQCCNSMILDAGLLCAGAPEDDGRIAHAFRRFIEEKIVNYAIVINSWLRDLPLKDIPAPREGVGKTAERIYSFLGAKDDIKVWLTACLLKTIKDGKKHRPEDGVTRPELIDGSPEATSWLREQLRT
jgi:hypothetical protein